MITFLTTFKPFAGDDALRQHNALASWLSLADGVQVIVFGNDTGVQSVVQKYGLTHYPDVPSFEGRLVRTDVIFEIGQAHGKHNLQAYVNGDIILGPDFARAFRAIPYKRFLMVGQRWDYDFKRTCEHSEAIDVPDLQARVVKEGNLHPPSGMDYFGYYRGTLKDIPPMFVGAVIWDGYMVQHCRHRNIPVVDVSRNVIAIHQNHGYSYLKGGVSELRHGAAAQRNKALAGNPKIPFVTLDASHVLVGGKVRSSIMSMPHLRRRIEAFPLRHSRWCRLTGVCLRLSRLLALASGGGLNDAGAERKSNDSKGR